MGRLRAGDVVCGSLHRIVFVRGMVELSAQSAAGMKTVRAILILALLLSGGFSLATLFEPRAVRWAGRSQSNNLMELLLGDSRRMLANHFFVKADIYFHSGYYPSIFDQARQAEENERAVA